MQANRFSTANRATLLVAACFMFLLSSCKKDDTTSPAGPSGKTCRPLSELDVTSNRLEHSYEYDAQGRIVLFTDQVYSGSQYVTVTTTVAYDGDNVILTENNPSTSRTRIYKFGKKNGRFDYRAWGPSLQDLPDTLFYFYTGDRLTKTVSKSRFAGALLSVTNEISYTEGLPTSIIVTDRDSSGVAQGSTYLRYTYDTREVTFSPYTIFMVAPGIETQKVTRMLKSLSFSYGPGTDSTVSNFQTVYDADGNVSQVTETATGYSAVTKFAYDCK